MRKMHKKYILCLVAVIWLCALTGCSDSDRLPTQIVLTSDFLENEVFRMEGMPCMKSEILIYLANSENKYSNVFGDTIWDTSISDTTLKERYKDTILARIAQIKVMNLLADEREIELTQEEEGKIIAAANEYFSSLSQGERLYFGCDLEMIQSMYREFLRAERVYELITKDVNPEISDDEARTITVQTILIKTYANDSTGAKAEFNDDLKADAYNRAVALKQRLDQGEAFEVLAADYNEDTNSEYSFGRGVMPEEFERVAFSLEAGQVSDIVQTEYGYHILKCVSTFDPDQTQANKATIVEQKRQQAFDTVYNEFVQNLTSNLNQPLWDSIEYDTKAGVTTTSFFDVFDSYFG